jgi:hypothetical protein
MDDLQKRAKTMEETGQKVLKILEKLDEATAFAVINYCFVIMVIDDKRGPNIAKAMTATFLNNVVNSINNYFQEGEEESVH